MTKTKITLRKLIFDRLHAVALHACLEDRIDTDELKEATEYIMQAIKGRNDSD